MRISGIRGSTIRGVLLSRPDLFEVEDRTNARGGRSYNVRLVRDAPISSSTSPRDILGTPGPIGAYPKAINPFKGGRI